MRVNIENAVNLYLQELKKDWIETEAYKFEFANYINYNINWDNQTNDQVFQILLNSQRIRYTDSKSKGIQFILVNGLKSRGDFITQSDVELLRRIQREDISEIDWNEKTMSYTALSAWISSLFPQQFYPIPAKGFDETIKHLFDVDVKKFPKTGMNYINACQSYMKETREILSHYPIENELLTQWNKFQKKNPELNYPLRTELTEVDWVWLAQDFHLFVLRRILGKIKTKRIKQQLEIPDEEYEAVTKEGGRKLITHFRIERNQTIIKNIKKKALIENPFLNCKVCDFSFYKKYHCWAFRSS
jgi:hypothetical protein